MRELHSEVHLRLPSRKASHNLASEESIRVITLYLRMFILSRRLLLYFPRLEYLGLTYYLFWNWRPKICYAIATL